MSDEAQSGIADEPLVIYSVGHSNQSLEKFLALLEAHHIALLVDVRSSPFSRYVTYFNRPELEYAVEHRSIGYRFMGQELGGRPEGTQFYDDEGYVLYYRVAEAGFFLNGLKRLEQAATDQRVAIMCSEEDPTNCHRRLLIGRVLRERGVLLRHIRGDGRLQDDAELAASEQPTHQAQLSLWGEPEAEEVQVEAWKSIRPVSPRKAPPNSSRVSDAPEYGDW